MSSEHVLIDCSVGTQIPDVMLHRLAPGGGAGRGRHTGAPAGETKCRHIVDIDVKAAVVREGHDVANLPARRPTHHPHRVCELGMSLSTTIRQGIGRWMRFIGSLTIWIARMSEQFDGIRRELYDNLHQLTDFGLDCRANEASGIRTLVGVSDREMHTFSHSDVDELEGMGCGRCHRLLDEHVQPPFEARSCDGVMRHVWRCDDDTVDNSCGYE